MQGTKVIRVYNEGLKKLDRINSERQQDMSRADTFDYILRVFEESLTKPRNAIAGNASSPIIDADNLRVVTPSTLAEKLYADKLRKDAQDLAHKAANGEAPTKNNTYQESKE
jgi:hypothetical protein